nr:hypothetical protein BaRGS_024027 [Batillaria attramentaria]
MLTAECRVAAMLLEAGVKVNDVDIHGETALIKLRTIRNRTITCRALIGNLRAAANVTRWNRHQWGMVLFPDESRFTLSHFDGRKRVWRRPGERFIDACVQEHDRYGGVSVMVWAGFH